MKKLPFLLILSLLVSNLKAYWEPTMTNTYSVAYAVIGTTPRDNRGIALSNDGQYLYLGYNNGPNFRRVNLSSSTVSGSNATDRSKSIAVDDQGRVYCTAANGEAVKIYNSTLTTLMLSITCTKTEGIAVSRISGSLYLFVTDRTTNKLSRYKLTESAGNITAATLDGLGGTGQVSVSIVSGGSGMRGVAIAPDGSILICDPGSGSGNGRITKLNSNGGGQVNYTFTGANNPYYMTIFDGQLYVSQGSYSTNPSRVAVVNYSDMTLLGFITPPWASLGIKTTDAADMISGICANSDRTGLYVTWENGSANDESYKEPVIKITFPRLTVSNVSFGTASGTYASTVNVTLSTNTSGATIRYTTDGTDPSESNGTVYSSAIAVSSNTLVKAAAFKTGYATSSVTSAFYNIMVDKDKDGVSDSEDAFPEDASRAFVNYFPAKRQGTLAFEDLWPYKGDYDMNDLVINYQFETVTNAEGIVVEMNCTFKLRAIGGSIRNGFGFQLPSKELKADLFELKDLKLPGKYVSLNEFGSEANQDLVTFIVFENAFDVITAPGGGTGVNTNPKMSFVEPVTIKFTIGMEKAKIDAKTLDIEHFNPFTFNTEDRGKEIHLPDYKPSSLANQKYFGLSEDRTNPDKGVYYKTENNLPWALNIYDEFDYPIEKIAIDKAYLNFVEWVQSNGEKYADWYIDNKENRNNEALYLIKK